MTASGLEFRTRELLPIQLRLEGLQKRLAYAQRTARIAKQDQMNGLPADLRIHIEIGARAHTMSHIRRGFSGIIKTLCISIDGSLPDGDDWYEAALCQVQGTGRGRRSILSPDLCARLRDLANDPSCPDLDLPDREMLTRLRDQLDTAADLSRPS